MRRFVLLSHAVVTLAYKAAYVEYTAVSPCGVGSCGERQRAASCEAYAQYVHEASEAKADIIVFPEYGITGFSSAPKATWVSGGYTETLPPFEDGVVPCDASSRFEGAPSVVALSCAAAKARVAVVANLMVSDGGRMFNTDVAFDTDGALLASYPKQNLWGEPNVDVPETCPIASFTTSFGVTFGLFTCADLIYEFPAGRLVDRGIVDFVMPAAWSDEMAQMQVLGFSQAWSLVRNATLVVANHRTSSESGSAVLRGGVVLASTFDTSPTADRLVVVDVGASPSSAPPPLPRRAPPADLRANRTGAWDVARLDSGTATACSGSVCCGASATGGDAAGYVVAALDGFDANDGESWAAQVCAVVYCASSSKTDACLGYARPPASAKLARVKVTMTGGAADALLFPEVIATGDAHEQRLLTPGAAADGYAFDAASSTVDATVTEGAIASATLYGRRFSADALPYHC